MRLLSLTLLLFMPLTALASATPMFEAPFLPFDVGAATIGVVTGDWNHDGWSDVAVTTGWKGGVSVLLGRGDATFGMRDDYPTGTQPGDLVAADVDGDREEDLIVADARASYEAVPGRISVLIGRGDGNFDQPYHLGIGLSFKTVAVADLNDDGHPDLVATNATTASVSVFMGSATGFGAHTDVAGLNPSWVALADCDGDNAIDAVVANGDYYNGRFTFLRGNHDGSFSPAGSFAVGSGPSSVALADLNGDHLLDVTVANNGIASPSLSVLFGDGTGAFGGRVDYPMPGQPRLTVARDVNLDGHPDLLATIDLGTLSILLGNGNGTFGPRNDHPVGPYPTSIAVADANGDAFPDLFVASHNPGSIGVLLGNGDGTFGLGRHLSTPGEGRAVRTADLDEDGRMDLLVVNQWYGTTFTAYLGLGNGSFSPGVDYAAGYWPCDLQVADLNGDGHTDVVVVDRTPTLAVRLGDGTGSLGPASTYEAGTGPFAIAVGELNGDLHPDLAVTQFVADSPTVVLLFGVGDGSFVRGPDLEAAGPAGHVEIGDATGDGRPDVVVANSYAGMVSVFRALEGGQFPTRDDYAVGVSPVAGPDFVLTRDLNGDGLLDLVAANSYPWLTTVTVLINDGAGGFGAKTEYDVPSGAAALVVEDFDSDSFLDIATANYHSNSASVLRGTGPGTFGDRRDFGVGGAPNALAAADFDGDGRVDLAVRGGGVWILRNATPRVPTAAVSIVLDRLVMSSNHVQATWLVSAGASFTGVVQRRQDGGEWGDLEGPMPVEGPEYVYEDGSIAPGLRYAYRLSLRSQSGAWYTNESWILVPSIEAAPARLTFRTPFPNPSRAGVTFQFGLPASGSVMLRVFDVQGREVAHVLSGPHEPGWSEVGWDGEAKSRTKAPAGVYFAVLEGNGEVLRRKFVLSR